MANTDLSEILRYVREAETEIASEIDKSGLTKEHRRALRDIYNLLLEFDEFLVVGDLNGKVNELEEKSGRLNELNQEIQKNISHLEQVAQKIDTVAKAINGLAKALGFSIVTNLG